MSPGKPIYLDHHATTPMDPRVLDRMVAVLREDFGNAASRQHAYGWKAEELIDVARGHVAHLIGATAREIIFTSGATESNNLALLGVARANQVRGRHIVSQKTEHKAVLDPLAQLAREGFDITLVGVDARGRVQPGEIAEALREDTILVSVMHANNEVGTLQPLRELGELCHQRGVLLHCDAAQGLATCKIDVGVMQLDLVSLSAHKMYGPKGVGALYVRRRDPRVTLEPILFGGGHERGLRPGTANVPGIVGFGEAARVVVAERDAEATRLAALRDQLEHGLRESIATLVVHGDLEQRLPGNLHVSIPGAPADQLLLELREVALSSGAACASASREPSHVLAAMGVSPDEAETSLRFGVGRFTTREEIRLATEAVVRATRRML